MTRDEFKVWKKRNRLKIRDVAAIMGVSERQVSKLTAGDRGIPGMIEGACWAYEHGWRPTNPGVVDESAEHDEDVDA